MDLACGTVVRFPWMSSTGRETLWPVEPLVTASGEVPHAPSTSPIDALSNHKLASDKEIDWSSNEMRKPVVFVTAYD